MFLYRNIVRSCSSAQAFQCLNTPIYFLNETDAQLWSTVNSNIFADLMSSGSANFLNIGQTPLSNKSIVTEKIITLDVQYVTIITWSHPVAALTHTCSLPHSGSPHVIFVLPTALWLLPCYTPATVYYLQHTGCCTFSMPAVFQSLPLVYYLTAHKLSLTAHLLSSQHTGHHLTTCQLCSLCQLPA